MTSPFTDKDLAFIRARGGRIDYVERQLQILSDPPPPIRLLRPCLLEDGVKSLAPRARELSQTWQDSADRRLLKFVPASGVASRMFSFLPAPRGSGSVSLDELRSRAARGEASADQTLRLLDEIERLAVFEDLDRLVNERTGRTCASLRESDPGLLLGLLVDAEGLDLGSRPKGLLPFHHYDSGTRTAFEEHLVEGAGYLGADASTARYHFTVSAEHESLFRAKLDRIRTAYTERLGRLFEVAFSNQEPSTDTIAIDARGEPVRDVNGGLLFRPGGHGSLLTNLGRLANEGHDLVFIKNIDNVPPERDHQPVIEWKRILAGHALELQHTAFRLINRLAHGASDPETVTRAAHFIESEFAIALPDHFKEMTYSARTDLLVDRLDRPLRVAGVVVNRGEPGGGPFWVARLDGSIDGQIVESAQIDQDDAGQARIWSGSTHFNPVDLVCALRDRAGRAYDLQRFVDQSTYFVTSKDHEGEPIRVLERPGLWNGAMAAWNTAFVEVPEETFCPVKTLVDLVRPAHRV